MLIWFPTHCHAIGAQSGHALRSQLAFPKHAIPFIVMARGPMQLCVCCRLSETQHVLKTYFSTSTSMKGITLMCRWARNASENDRATVCRWATERTHTDIETTRDIDRHPYLTISLSFSRVCPSLGFISIE